MDIFYGAAFQNFIEHRSVLTEVLLQRAIAKRIITECGAEFLRNLQ